MLSGGHSDGNGLWDRFALQVLDDIIAVKAMKRYTPVPKPNHFYDLLNAYKKF